MSEKCICVLVAFASITILVIVGGKWNVFMYICIHMYKYYFMLVIYALLLTTAVDHYC